MVARIREIKLPGGANATHALSQNMGDPLSWDDRIWTVGIDDHIAEGVVPAQTANGDELAGEIPGKPSFVLKKEGLEFADVAE